jgi:hypothetical protein
VPGLIGRGAGAEVRPSSSEARRRGRSGLWLGPALALVGLLGCEEESDPGSLPNFGAPPLYDQELARCEVLQQTTYRGVLLESKLDLYDAGGHRTEERFDVGGADTWSRVHLSTWDGLDLLVIEGTDTEDEAFAWLETFERTDGTVLSHRRSGDRAVGASRERWDVLSTYTYDLGVLERIDEDDGADGTIDRRIEFVWSEDFHRLVERRDDIAYERTIDDWLRVLTEVQRPSDPNVPAQSAAFVYDAAHPAWPTVVYVDLESDGAPEVSLAWTYDCP